MPDDRQFAVLGPLQSGVPTRAFLGVELLGGESSPENPVVVVWLPDEVVADERQLARCRRETAFVTQLRHPNLIDVHGLVHFEEGWARIVAFVDGEPLSRILRDLRASGREMPPELAARMIIDVCSGVQHAHEEGMSRFNGRAIVHGGIRPDTLMVSFDGRIRVTGYGAAMLAHHVAHNVDDNVNAPPSNDLAVYLAPEQVLGGRATASPATDVYAIGAVLYELIAGEPPFADADNIENAILGEAPPMVGDGGLAARLGAVAAHALAKRGPDRFESVEALKTAVLEAIEDEGIPVASPTTLAKLLDTVIPHDAPERLGRRELLASALDPDTITPLTPVPVADELVLSPAHAASQLTTGDATQVALRTAPPRESETVVEPEPADRERRTTIADAVRSSAGLGSATPETPPDEALTHGRIQVSDLLDPEDSAASDPPPETRAPAPDPAPDPDAAPTLPDTPAPGPASALESSVADPTARLAPPAPADDPPPSDRPRATDYPPPPAPPMPGVLSTSADIPPGAVVVPVGYVPATQPIPQPPRVAPRSNPGQKPLAEEDPRLANPPVSGLPPPPEKKSSPIRDQSASITFFNRRAGDASRSVFAMVLLVAIGLLGVIVAFPKEPPAGLDQPSERTRLPAELVQEALTSVPDTASVAVSAVASAVPGVVGASDTASASSPRAASAGPAAVRTATASEAVTPARKPAAAPGSVVVDSDPPVSVFVGDTGYGRTPARLTLAPGRHRVRLTDAKTGINAYRTIRVKSGDRLRRDFSFGTCQLKVDAPSGAVVKLNARVLGTAPLTEQTIYEGRYLLRVSYLGAVWSERIAAPPGGRLAYTVNLKDAPR